MSRSRLTNTTRDAVTDGGSVLWSIVKGEQLEFPVVLNFIEDTSERPSNNYIYEAVVVEGNNILAQTSPPVTIRNAGAQDTLVVRLPVYVGVWSALSAYNKEEVILYNTVYYKLSSGVAYVSSVTPDIDPNWEETTLNTVYIQFPALLGDDWAVKAIVDSPVYGFFELRVSEPADPIFVKIWKPVRGMVEILFSPTDIVADL